MLNRKVTKIENYKVEKSKEKIVKKNYKVVRVYWHDIISQSSWLEKQEVEDLDTANAMTYGLLVEENNKFVKIAGSISLEDNPDFGDITTLPKAVVLCIEKIGSFDMNNEAKKSDCFKRKQRKEK